MARKNGWQAPFHLLQVLTWFVFPSIMVLFGVFYTPLLDTTATYLGSLVRVFYMRMCLDLYEGLMVKPNISSPSRLSQAYGASCLFTVYSVIICTRMDPSDDCILRPSSVRAS